jgi:hypothetical protein
MFLIKRSRLETGPLSGRKYMSERYWNGDRFSLFQIRCYPTQDYAEKLLEKLIGRNEAVREECTIITEAEYHDRNLL